MHILTAEQFTRFKLEELFWSALTIQHDHAVAEKPWLLSTLFFEPSTRTRLSFEAAALRLGGQTISVANALASSSTVKGESLEDTIKTVSQIADIIVLRHPEQGAAAAVAAVSSVPIINAGDGVGHHPTQAVLDAYTIWRENFDTEGHIDGKTILIYGDLQHARTINSLLSILSLFNVEILQRDLSAPMDADLVGRADVIYMTRPQTERHLSNEQKYYGLEKDMLPFLKDDAIVMHPLPRASELPTEVEQDPRAVFFKQIQYGVQIRMALLQDILGLK